VGHVRNRHAPAIKLAPGAADAGEMELDLVRTPVYVLCAAGIAGLVGGNIVLATAAAFLGLAISVTPRTSFARPALLVVLSGPASSPS
jgi:hypothetical protein